VRASRFGSKSFDLDYELRVDGELVAVARASRSPTTTTGASRSRCGGLARKLTAIPA